MSTKTNSKNWLIFLSVSLLLGIVLRLSFPGDIEYKYDEKFMFDVSQAIGVTEPWPALGMVSGGQVKNPGMSIWIFVALARITHATTPVELARAVELLNILGLLALAYFSLRLLPEKERLTWCWATAFAAVSPVGLFFQRKIWAQSTLPLFCVLLWMAWHYRKTRWGAFFWGLIGLCIAQIHMSGFYLIAGLFLWTLYQDRKTPKWGSWVAGSIVGAIPMIPWLQYLLSNAGKGTSQMNFFWALYPKYWIFWVTDALGFGFIHSLKWSGFYDFLRYPVIGGVGTYLVGILHLFMIFVAIRVSVVAWKNSKGFVKGLSDHSETGLLLNALFIATGVLMTLSFFKINQHYLIMTFPLEWVWLSKLGLKDGKWGQKHLMWLWAAQLVLSIAFLLFIHVNHGYPAGDYGTAYQYQKP